jgi:hypothetical protein
MAKYPKPDIKRTIKSVIGLISFLIVLHLMPDIATWIHAQFFGQGLVINERRYKMMLFVAYVLVGVAVAIDVAGQLWAIWHNR